MTLSARGSSAQIQQRPQWSILHNGYSSHGTGVLKSGFRQNLIRTAIDSLFPGACVFLMRICGPLFSVQFFLELNLLFLFGELFLAMSRLILPRSCQRSSRCLISALQAKECALCSTVTSRHYGACVSCRHFTRQSQKAPTGPKTSFAPCTPVFSSRCVSS